MPYLSEMFKKVKDSGLGENPGFYTMEIAHDDWCDLINDKGECNCNPDIKPPEKGGYENE